MVCQPSLPRPQQHLNRGAEVKEKSEVTKLRAKLRTSNAQLRAVRGKMRERDAEIKRLREGMADIRERMVKHERYFGRLAKKMKGKKVFIA